MHEIIAISCLNKTQLLILEIGSDLWQLNGWPYSTAPKEPSHGKVSEKEILYWIFNLRKHLQSVWWSLRKFAYGFWETRILWLLSPSSVSNNVKETYGVPPGISNSWPMSLVPTNGGSGEVCEKNLFFGKGKMGRPFLWGEDTCFVYRVILVIQDFPGWVVTTKHYFKRKC